MTNGMQTIARHLADAAQAMGADAMSALAAELATRQAAPKAAPEGDFSKAVQDLMARTHADLQMYAARTEIFTAAVRLTELADAFSKSCFRRLETDKLRPDFKVGDLIRSSEVQLSPNEMAAVLETDNQTGRVEALVLNHPLFTVTIKPRG